MNYLRLLQLRRDANAEGGQPATSPAAESGEPAAKPAEGEKTYTQAEHQAELNRVVQKTLASEREKADAAVKAARTEAERLASMTAEQRLENERQQRESALAKREAEITRRELRATAQEAITQRGLPLELADTLNYADADSVTSSLAAIEKAYRAAVQKGVEGRMKGEPPKSADGKSAEEQMLAKVRQAAGLK